MSDFAENLRAFLIADSGVTALVGARVHQNHAPQKYDRPFVWLRLRGTENLDKLDDAVGAEPFRLFYDLECVSPSVAQAASLASTIKSILHNYRGAMGSGSVRGAFVQDHDDDYVPRSVDGDNGLHVAALDVELIPIW
jgi:hypothetical protein